MLQSAASLPIIVMRAESDEVSTIRTELTCGKSFYAVATHLDLYDPEVRPAVKLTRAACPQADLAQASVETACCSLLPVPLNLAPC